MALKKFKYKATDSAGKEYEGAYRAETREEVADYLRGRELLIVSINQDLGLDLESLQEIQIGGVSLKDRMYVAKQLATMMRAGLPIIQTLEILSKQLDNKSLQQQLTQVKTEVEGGATLSSAFQKYAPIFSDVQINLLAAGEKSGNLSDVVQQVALDMEKSNELRSKIRSAMIYPAIIFLAIIGVMFILVTFMIPTVEDLYADFDAADQMPAITRFLVNISNFIGNPIGIVVILIVSLIGYVGFRSYNSSENGHYVIGSLVLKMPVFGQIIAKIQLAQFGRLLSMLLRSGVSIIDALNIVSKALGNPVYSKAVKDTIQDVSKGVPLASPLSNSGVFPLLYTRMISTGEQTGNLDQVLDDMGKYYEAEVNEMTDNLTKLMEPLILLVVGGMVGFLAVAVYLPIYSIGNVIT
ncbi:MAG: type II secretion system F family protein [Candidatus Dojkabacteria bacterium]